MQETGQSLRDVRAALRAARDEDLTFTGGQVLGSMIPVALAAGAAVVILTFLVRLREEA